MIKPEVIELRSKIYIGNATIRVDSNILGEHIIEHMNLKKGAIREALIKLGWTPPEESDPYKEFKDHIANGGVVEVEVESQNGRWYPRNDFNWDLPPHRYRCVPIPIGEQLVGKLCWLRDDDCREKAIEDKSIGVVRVYEHRQYVIGYGYARYNYAWPVTRSEMENLLA